MTDIVLEQIQKSALKFLEPKTLNATYRIIVNEAVKLTQSKHGTITIQKDNNLIPVYSNAPPNYQVIPRKKGYNYFAHTTGKVICINRKQMDKAHPEHAQSFTDINSVIFIPLRTKNHSIGILGLQSEKFQYFTKEKIKTIKLFSSLATMAIRNCQMYEEMEKALKTRDLFISVAAHELKSPLTTIRTYAQLLKDSIDKPINPKIAVALDKESTRLHRLLNEFLTVEQIKTGQFKYIFNECSLKEICLRALIDFKSSHPAHPVIYEDKLTHFDDKIVGDSDKLIEATTNLLNNAAKFSSPTSPITVTLSHHKGNLTISVADQGKGIIKKEINNIFNQYYQGNNKVGGMGLGLYVVKDIIDQHKASINVKSKVGQGTTIRLMFNPSKHTMG
jgi:signal transduction histidine kinase